MMNLIVGTWKSWNDSIQTLIPFSSLLNVHCYPFFSLYIIPAGLHEERLDRFRQRPWTHHTQFHHYSIDNKTCDNRQWVSEFHFEDFRYFSLHSLSTTMMETLDVDESWVRWVLSEISMIDDPKALSSLVRRLRWWNEKCQKFNL